MCASIAARRHLSGAIALVLAGALGGAVAAEEAGPPWRVGLAKV